MRASHLARTTAHLCPAWFLLFLLFNFFLCLAWESEQFGFGQGDQDL